MYNSSKILIYVLHDLLIMTPYAYKVIIGGHCQLGAVGRVFHVTQLLLAVLGGMHNFQVTETLTCIQ